MWHYAYGKPREAVALESTDPQKLNIVVRYDKASNGKAVTPAHYDVGPVASDPES